MHSICTYNQLIKKGGTKETKYISNDILNKLRCSTVLTRLKSEHTGTKKLRKKPRKIELKTWIKEELPLLKHNNYLLYTPTYASKFIMLRILTRLTPLHFKHIV